MLTSALNFLTDKRKKFSRSDTMPIFDPISIDKQTAAPSHQTSIDTECKANVFGLKLTSTTDQTLKKKQSCDFDGDKQHVVFSGCGDLEGMLFSQTDPGTFDKTFKSPSFDLSLTNRMPSKHSSTAVGLSNLESQSKSSNDKVYILNGSEQPVQSSSEKLRIYSNVRWSEEVESDNSKIESSAPVSTKVPKSKLQRSRSSAQLIKDKQNQEVAKRQRFRSTSDQRESEEDLKQLAGAEQTESRRKKRKQGKSWIERGRRSRSVASFQKPTVSKTKELSDTATLFPKAPIIGTFEKYMRISTFDGSRIMSSTPRSLVPLQPKNNLQSQQRPTNIVRGDSFHATTNYNASNRLGFRKKEVYPETSRRHLRRNNSTVDRNFERTSECSWKRTVIDPMSDIAGDLFLPSQTLVISHDQGKEEPKSDYRPINELIKFITESKFEELVQNSKRLLSMSEQFREKQLDDCDVNRLGVLDFAILKSSPKVVAFLMALGYQPGPVLNDVLLKTRPGILTMKDPLKFHFVRCIGDVDLDLLALKHELKNKLRSTNEKQFQNNIDPNVLSETTKSIYAQITETENAISDLNLRREMLVELYRKLNELPSITEPPEKVRLTISSPSAILVRVSPHRGFKRMESKQLSAFSSQTSGESSVMEDPEEKNEGGRKFSELEPKGSYTLPIKYCIEWSESSDYPDNQTFACVVEPPVRLNAVLMSVTNDSNQIRPSCSYFRTGFYELADIQKGKTYFVRVYSLSLRGWSRPQNAYPFGVCLSSWCDSNEHRCNDGSSVGISQITETPLQPRPMRFMGPGFKDEFRVLKQLLDQQLLLWMYKQPSSTTDGAGSANDESNKRTRSPILQRKRSFRFPFGSKGPKFVKQIKSGIYLALVCHSRVKSSGIDENAVQNYILTNDESLPILCVTNDVPPATSFNNDVNWFGKLITDPSIGPDLQLTSETMHRIQTPSNLQFRDRLLAALLKLQNALGTYDVGFLYPECYGGRKTQVDSDRYEDKSSIDETDRIQPIPIERQSDSSNSVVLVLLKHVAKIGSSNLSGGLKWSSFQKFMRQNKLNFELTTSQTYSDDRQRRFSLEEGGQDSKIAIARSMIFDPTSYSPDFQLLTNLEKLIYHSENRSSRLPPGLYLTFIKMQASMDQQATVLLSGANKNPYMFPVRMVRRRSHVTSTEWNALLGASRLDQSIDLPVPSRSDYKFCHNIVKCAKTLLKSLNYPEADVQSVRIFVHELIQISPQHSLILLFPTVDQICLPPGSNVMPPPGCSWISMNFVERTIGLAYDPSFYSHLYSLQSILELLLQLSNFMQRQSLSETEWSQSSERTQALQSIQQQLDGLYTGKRWLSDSISNARDKKRYMNCTISLEQIDEFLTRMYQDSLEAVKKRPVKNPLLDDFIGYRYRRKHGDGKHSKSETQSLSVEALEQTTIEEQSKSQISKSLPDSKHMIIRVHLDDIDGIIKGTFIKILINSKSRASDILRLTLEKIQSTEWIKLENNVDCLSLPPIDRFCLSVWMDGVCRSIPEHIRPYLLKQPWKSGRFVMQLKGGLGSVESNNSPVRIYLSCEHVLVQSNEAQVIYKTVRSRRAQIRTVPNTTMTAHVSHPPVVYQHH